MPDSVSRPSLTRLQFGAILLCFFSSGAAGLIYQVAWGKALGLVFGNTVYAVATVLAVFMGGLALGSAKLGKWCDRAQNAVALYGWIELGVAASGALSLLGLAGVRMLYLAAFPHLGGSAVALVALRFVGAAIVLLIPTFLMGGTLPILVKGVSRSRADLGRRISRLYWVNTLGAVVGTMLAGFYLLPVAGLRLTVGVAVSLNILAGLLALLASRSHSAVGAIDEEETALRSPFQTADSSLGLATPRILLISFAVVGGTAIVYEVAWTRMLAAVLGSSVYAFTLMLTAFLSGIVIGSRIFEWWQERGGKVSLSTFAVTQTLTAIFVLAFLVFFTTLPEVVPPMLRGMKEGLWDNLTKISPALVPANMTFWGLAVTQFVTSTLAMLAPAIVFGFNFPAVTLLITRSLMAENSSAAIGRAYAFNTLGAIAGATLAGFWLMPTLGAFRLVGLAVVLNLTIALLMELLRQPRRIFALLCDFALLSATVWIVATGAFYNRAVAVHGTVVYWDMYEGKLSVKEVSETTDLLFSEDGLNATISVTASEDYISLRTNGKVDASNKDNITQMLLGHLGGVFHPAPRRILIIGFGSGMTVSALLRYPDVESVTCVEIEPAVIHAAKYLESLNRGALRDKRLHVVLDDARNFLLTTREKYDVIISEPSNPWIAGVASLYTDEYYREARGRLNPGGVFIQWVQAYALFHDDLKMILGTFAPHFPQVTLWHAESTDLFLVGQTDTSQLNFDRLRKFSDNPEISADYETLGMKRPEALAGYYMLDDAGVRRLGAQAPQKNTDNHTRLEYTAPRALLTEGLGNINLEKLSDARSGPLPPQLRVEDRNLALLGAAEVRIAVDELSEAATYLDKLSDAPRTVDLDLARAKVALSTNQFSDAQENFQHALLLDHNCLEAAVGLANVSRKRLRYGESELLFRQVLQRDPKYDPALAGLYHLNVNREDWPQAVEFARRRIAVSAKPDADLYANLGEVLLKNRQLRESEMNFLQAVLQDQYSYSAHQNLGEIYVFYKKWDDAIRELNFVVRFHPDVDSKTYLLLAQAYRAQGREREAEAALAKGRRLFPKDASLTAPVIK